MNSSNWIDVTTASIDVLLTVYNGERFIAQTLDSVLAQTFTDWRLIIVDDLSTDRTAEIVASYVERDPRILLVKGEHKGIAAAANIGLTHVTAPLVARLDGDDIALPERLQVQFDYLQQHPDVLAVGSDVMLIDEHNKPLRRRKAPTGWENIREILKTRNCMCHPSATIRTEALRRIGGYRDKFKNSLDYDLWLRISEIGKIENISQDLLLYRRHASQVSASGNAHRQTIYSVGAATDYFLRKYGYENLQTHIDESDNDDLAEKLIVIYQSSPKDIDMMPLNRHSMRLLRYAIALSPGARRNLRKVVWPFYSVREKIKSLMYILF
jgi:glycosyltransferase involved in cell wall biosynthesis